MRLMSGKIFKNGTEEQLDEFEDATGQATGQDTGEDTEQELEYNAWLRLLTHNLETCVGKVEGGVWEEEALRRKFRWVGHVLRRGHIRRVATVIRVEIREKRRLSESNPGNSWSKLFENTMGTNWQDLADEQGGEDERRLWRDQSGLVSEEIVRRL